jgi:hypothetical protein
MTLLAGRGLSRDKPVPADGVYTSKGGVMRKAVIRGFFVTVAAGLTIGAGVTPAVADPGCTGQAARAGAQEPGPFGRDVVSPTARSVPGNFGQTVIKPEATAPHANC